MALKVINCPWCSEPFEIETGNAAFAYRCPHCNEESGIEAIENPNKHPKRIEIHQHISMALGDHLHRFTLPMLYTQHGEPAIASGTLVSIADHSLLITAGHVINARTKLDAQFLAKEGKPGEPVRVNIFEYGKRDLDDADVGFVELEDGTALQSLNVSHLELDRVLDLGAGDSGRTTRVYGYPAEWLMQNDEQVQLWHALSLGTTAINPKYWPSIDWETRNPSADKDIVLDFDRASEYWSHAPDHLRMAKLAGNKPPEPFGMSGGGCWQGDGELEDSAVWSPDRVCLFGIQSRWPRYGRFLRAVQVIHWLRLIADSYPDLNADLVARYPRIEELRNP